MTDITTTGTDTAAELGEISFIRDNRTVAIGEIARAEATARDALARVAELEAENNRLRFDQITDGGDPASSTSGTRRAGSPTTPGSAPSTTASRTN